MTYVKNFLQLTWGGRYFDEDIWVNGLHLIDVAPDAETTFASVYTQEVLNDLAFNIQSMHTAPTGNHSAAMLDWVKLAIVGPNGKYVTDPITVDFSVDMPGGNGGVLYPQLATAVSLRTAKKRGPGSVGRFYAPVALVVDGRGHVESFILTDFVGNVANMVNEINNTLIAAEPDGSIKVGNVSKVGLGTQEPVTNVAVGDVVDTQRRRRNKFREAYSVMPVGSIN
jgi:hypothetical protein